MQYGVDESLITLVASAGSVQLTITLATASSTGAAVDLTTLQQNIATVDISALSTTIGSVMGVAVNVTTSPSIMSSVIVSRNKQCQKGYWVSLPSSATHLESASLITV